MRPFPLLLAAGVFLAALIGYSGTAAPDLALVDSAELALTAATGGVAHPPGVPLYLLVGRAFAALPGGSPARALNLMSAFWMAAAVGALYLAGERILALLGHEIRNRRIAALAGAGIFATSFNPWVWSAVAEVYALNVFLLAASWGFAWRAAEALEGTGPTRGARGAGTMPPGAWRDITLGAIFAALGLANHHATALLAFPTLILLVLLFRPSLLRSPRLWVAAIGSVVGALALYLYLFIAARNDPALSWGGIDSFETLFRHIRGAQYSEQVGSPPGESARVMREFFSTLWAGSGWPAALLVATALLGLGRAALRGRRPELAVLTALIGTIGLNLLLSVNYIAGPEDRMAYDLPATAAWALLATAGTGVLLAAAARRRSRVVFVTAFAAIGLAFLLNVVRNRPLCDISEEHTARRLVEETLGDLPGGAVVITAEWNLYAPYLYMRHLENWRRDLRVVDVLMLRRHWYLDYLAREMPDLVEAAPVEFERFREQIRRFDLGQAYDQINIQRWYDELILAWLRHGQATGGGYAEWSVREHPQETGWLTVMPAVPDDMLLRFPAAGETPDTPIVKPKNRANLEWVRSRLSDEVIAAETMQVPIPRHDPYRKVWRSYAVPVEASLLVAARTGEAELRALHEALRPWYPEADAAVARVR